MLKLGFIIFFTFIIFLSQWPGQSLRLDVAQSSGAIFFSHGKGLQLTRQPEMSLSGHQRRLSSLTGKGTDRSWLKSPLPVLPHPFCQPIRMKRETFPPVPHPLCCHKLRSRRLRGCSPKNPVSAMRTRGPLQLPGDSLAVKTPPP